MGYYLYVYSVTHYIESHFYENLLGVYEVVELFKFDYRVLSSSRVKI